MRRLARLLAVLSLPALLAACGAAGDGSVDTYGHAYATDAEVAAAAYRHDGPPRLTLMTMVNNRTGSGGHTALMVNASQRVIWDPAGTVNNKQLIVEKGDVLYGISPAVEGWYKRAHARETHHVVVQDIDVSPEVAELALRLVQEYGGAGSATCALATSAILARIPGFESIRSTWYPVQLSEQFQAIPGVRRSALYEYDDADKERTLEAWDPERFRAEVLGR